MKNELPAMRAILECRATCRTSTSPHRSVVQRRRPLADFHGLFCPLLRAYGFIRKSPPAVTRTADLRKIPDQADGARGTEKPVEGQKRYGLISGGRGRYFSQNSTSCSKQSLQWINLPRVPKNVLFPAETYISFQNNMLRQMPKSYQHHIHNNKTH
ncbi:hypothetical protein ACLG6S_07575 [Thermodesulfobacteriota bacterium B35]